MISGTQLLHFKIHGDERGSLIAIENNRNIEFEIKRVYYIFGTGSNVIRGKHAHKDLRQVLVCVSGSCDILLDNGRDREIVRLDSPDTGIYIYSFIWREMMNFSKECVLVAFVDREYNRDDYIYDYESFKAWISHDV